MSVTETITAPVITRRIHSENESAIALEALQSRTQGDSQDATSHLHHLDDGARPDDTWDSREGWKVVVAGASIFFVCLGLVYSYGIVQLHLERRQLANVPTLSFIGSVAVSKITGRRLGALRQDAHVM